MNFWYRRDSNPSLFLVYTHVMGWNGLETHPDELEKTFQPNPTQLDPCIPLMTNKLNWFYLTQLNQNRLIKKKFIIIIKTWQTVKHDGSCKFWVSSNWVKSYSDTSNIWIKLKYVVIHIAHLFFFFSFFFSLYIYIFKRDNKSGSNFTGFIYKEQCHIYNIFITILSWLVFINSHIDPSLTPIYYLDINTILVLISWWYLHFGPCIFKSFILIPKFSTWFYFSLYRYLTNEIEWHG